ncbi:MAG: extracellular solute-binding protein [Anaerolineales bacterium]|nr:extracellular solute-binding protein [Anaerolineales bacterium]
MERTTLSRRAFLTLAGAAGGSALLAACQAGTTAPTQAPAEATEAPPEATEAPPAAEAVTIEWWWGWTPDMLVNTLNAVADKFTEHNPEIEVTTAQHEWGEKLLTAYAAGTPPDIHEHWLPMQFAARDLLQPLDDRIATSSVISIDLMPEVSWTAGTWEGKRYIVPCLAYFAELALVVNPAVFQNAGLTTPDDVPTTYDGIFDQSVKYNEFDDAGNLNVVWMEPDKSLRYMPPSYGLTPYNADEHKWTLTGDDWEAAVMSVARFYTEFGPEKLDAFHEAYPGWIAVPGSAFASDRLAMVTSGYWIPGELQTNAPDKEFVYTYPPTGGAATGKKVTHWGAHSVMIPQLSKHPDQAWKLTEYLCTNEAAEMILEGCGWIGPMKTFWDVMDVNTFLGLDFFVNDLAKNVEVATANPPSPAIAFAFNSFSTDVTDAVIYGDKDAATALADFEAAVNEEEQRLLEGD